MSKEKANDLSSVAWLNLVLGLYNIYLFTVGHLMFNFIVGSLNVGVWAFFRNPETLLSLTGVKDRKNRN
jgi:hypothetical protein|tara:strand:- start:142 stop:348 length:207 start_codon:yes stop_codon:yes gene_type:complete